MCLKFIRRINKTNQHERMSVALSRSLAFCRKQCEKFKYALRWIVHSTQLCGMITKKIWRVRTGFCIVNCSTTKLCRMDVVILFVFFFIGDKMHTGRAKNLSITKLSTEFRCTCFKDFISISDFIVRSSLEPQDHKIRQTWYGKIIR